MAASPFIALIVLVTIAAARPSSLAVAGPLLALWVAAPLVAYWLSQPVSPERQLVSSEDRRFLRLIARKTWRYFETFMGAEDHGLPPDNFQETPTPRLAHRTSPTNIGMGLLSTLAAHDLGFIRTPELVERLEATVSTMGGLERFEGHLLNWYDTRTLAPLPPRYVSTVDSGNLAGALLALAEGLRRLAGEPQSAAQICAGLVDTAEIAGQYLARLADTPAGHQDGRARLVAVVKSVLDVLEGPEEAEQKLARGDGQVPALREAIESFESEGATSSHQVEAAYWSRSLAAGLTAPAPTPGVFATRLEELASRALAFVDGMSFAFLYDRERQIFAIGYRLADAQGPGRLDPSYYDLLARPGNYQYKAFGVPGLGLKRGLGDELVVAPYATALAAMVDPVRAAHNFRRLAREGLDGAYGFYEAIDYTHRKADDGETVSEPRPHGSRGVVVQAFLAHHQGMSLVALANAVLGHPMVQRLHADPRMQATAPLLQERAPRHAPITQPRPAEETRVAAPVSAVPVRRFRSPHTRYPHAQFLSNGAYTAIVTNAGGGASFFRGRALTRYREDSTRDLGSHFPYLPDLRPRSVWSPAYHPTDREPEEYLVTFQAERAIFRRRDEDIATQLDVAVSTEDDVEVRRLAVTNLSDRPRELEVTSYAEIALASVAEDLSHPAFSKLFVETEYLPESAALVCARRPRARDEARVCAVTGLGLDGGSHG